MDILSTVVRSSFFFLDKVGNGFRNLSYSPKMLKSYVKGMVDETLIGGPTMGDRDIESVQ